MPQYELVRAVNVRRYFRYHAFITADDPQEAFLRGAHLIQNSHNNAGWYPDDKGGHNVSENEVDPASGALDCLSVEEVVAPNLGIAQVEIDFTEVPHPDEPVSYDDLLFFVKRIAAGKVSGFDAYLQANNLLDFNRQHALMLQEVEQSVSDSEAEAG